jgi:hypothetical protein
MGGGEVGHAVTALRDALEALCQRQCRAIFADQDLIEPQTVQRAQLILEIAECLGEHEHAAPE